MSADPFIGPRPYAEADRDDFFGRSHQTEELVSMLTANRVVLLYAVSGAGKTSLLRAGLIPALVERSFQVFGPIRPKSPVPPPPSSPNVFVRSVMTELVDATGVNVDFTSSTSLVDVLAALPTETDAYGFRKARCLVLDQFEELLTAFPERWGDRQGFLEDLAAALEADSSLRVLLSIREDYLAQVERYAGVFPDGFGARYHLERFRHDDALAAIRGPLSRRGFRIADQAAGQLIGDLSQSRVDVGRGSTSVVVGEFVEPVHLQVVGRRLWHDAKEGAEEITVRDLDRLGGVDDCLTSYYEAAVSRAGRGSARVERRIRAAMESQFITASGTRASVFVSPKGTDQLSSAELADLEDAHLVRGEWRAGARWLEIAHDRLVEPIRNSNDRIRSTRRSRRLRRTAAAGGVALLAALVSVVLVGGGQDEALQAGPVVRPVLPVVVVRETASSPGTGPNGTVGKTKPRRPGSRAQHDRWGRRTALTVILASHDTLSAARSGVRLAERRGLHASVLYSTLHASLHPGYWVVFSGRFQTYGKTIARLNKAHALGFTDAQWSYVLPIGSKR